MLISDILHIKGREVFTIRPDQLVSDAVERMAYRHVGALVVEDKLKPIGIISERDVINRLAKSGARSYGYFVRELMTSPIITARPGDPVEGALALMTNRRIRHLPVIENDELAGLVSLGDLVKARLDQKELEAAVLLDMTRMRA